MTITAIDGIGLGGKGYLSMDRPLAIFASVTLHALCLYVLVGENWVLRAVPQSNELIEIQLVFEEHQATTALGQGRKNKGADTGAQAAATPRRYENK